MQRNDLNLSLMRRIALEPELVTAPSNNVSPTILLDVPPAIREVVCKAVRDEIPKAWIIVVPETRVDRYVPLTADCLSSASKEADGTAAVEPGRLGDSTASGVQLYDMIVACTDDAWTAERALKLARGYWRVDPLVAEKVKTGYRRVLARIGCLLRRVLFCSAGNHRRISEVKSSVFVLKVCEDCNAQISYRTRHDL